MYYLSWSTASNAPVINAVIAINNSTVHVTWTRPTMPNGIITTYTIIYFTDSNSGNVSVPNNVEEVSVFINEKCVKIRYIYSYVASIKNGM